MASTSPMAGTFRLLRVTGITVHVHWSWLLVAIFEIQTRANSYTSQAWNVAEYLAIFGIVLLHEFGHALACRQVGGRADDIILWPLGGIAFVSPPQRPGAVLWSIAAGPLVNVVLAPVTIVTLYMAGAQGLPQTNPDADHFIEAVAMINLGLLIFNMLPIYPLDGGQIVQAILWFVIGRATSLMVVSVLGMIAAAGVVGLAVWYADIWFGILAVFAASRCWAGLQQARFLAQLAKLPRRDRAVCPSCGAHPLLGDVWQCEQCGARFDTFEHHGVCPACGQSFSVTTCVDCGRAYAIEEWFGATKEPGNENEPAPNG